MTQHIKENCAPLMWTFSCRAIKTSCCLNLLHYVKGLEEEPI